ncbi:MAG: VOC family protein [Rhodobacteraceae bacterium]|nr:VOC family protein [Paracoccaceae bacterium]
MTGKQKKVAAIPRGFRSLTPHVTVSDVAAALAFYQRALGAKEGEVTNFAGTDTPAFAELRIGNSLMTLGQGEAAPVSGISLHHYVEDFDAAWANALAEGFVETTATAETSWGDLMATAVDPFGVRWSIAQRVVRLTKEEKAERALAPVSGAAKAAPAVEALTADSAPMDQRLN